jgi:hypothetical protein
MGDTSLDLVDGLQLFKPILCTRQAKCCWQTHQAQVGVDVSPLFSLCE